MVPVTFTFNADEDTIDVGGVNFGASKGGATPSAAPVTFLLDDVLRDPGAPAPSRSAAAPRP